MRTALHYVALVAGMCLAGASGAAAQSNKLEHDCKKAVKIVERGKPDRKEEWAWSTVLGCGAEGGTAARDAWLQMRTETEPRQLEALYGRLWSFRDGALFDAAQSVATDASASPESRVYSAMLLLVLLFDRRDPEYDYFISVGKYGVCRVGSVDDRVIFSGSPLPADARERVRLVGRQLQSDVSGPAIVQSAGRCLDQTLLIDDRVRARQPIAPPGS